MVGGFAAYAVENLNEGMTLPTFNTFEDARDNCQAMLLGGVNQLVVPTFEVRALLAMSLIPGRVKGPS
jgi:hypothetical protein